MQELEVLTVDVVCYRGEGGGEDVGTVGAIRRSSRTLTIAGILNSKRPREIININV